MTTFNSYKAPSPDTSDILPGFVIKKILVGQEKISLTCAIRRPTDINYENWLGSSEFGQYVKYYFIIAPNLSEEDKGKFHYPDERITLITRNTYPSPGTPNVSFSNWESVLGPKTFISPSSAVALPDPKRAFNPYNFFGFSSLSLNEIIQGQFFSKDPLSAMENKEPIQYSTTGDSQGFNTSFELDVFFSAPLDLINQDLSILAFSHIDLASIAEDYGIEITNHMVGLGSPSQFEECLKYSDTNGLTVPRTRKAFFTESGIQYRGPVHYHSSDNPAPNGYVGWMSGPGMPPLFGDEEARLRAQNRMMESAFRLQVREVPNTKVFSKLFAELALNYEGKPLTAQNSYSGFVQDSVLGSLNDSVDSGLLSFGEDIQRTLKSQMGHIPTIDDSLSMLYQERLGKLTELSLKKGRLIFQGDVHSDISLGNFSHDSIFFINIGDIVSSNSRLGHLYEMHREAENEYSQLFIENVTFYSKIIDFTIRRIRVTNSPLENNAASTGIYGVYDKNEEKKLIIKAGPPQNGSDILSTSNEKAEVSSLQYIEETQTLGIKIVDYDLFDNYNTGNYKYEISMSIEDGITRAVREILKDYKVTLRQYTNLVKLASIPYLDYESSGYYNGSKFVSKTSQFNDGLSESISRDLEGATGNYNYKTGQFTPSFVARSTELFVLINDMVESYIFAFSLMTGKVMTPQQEQELKQSLSIKNTNLDGMEYFLSLCLKVEKQLEILAEKSPDNISNTLNLGSHRRGVPKGVDFPNEVISVVGTPKVMVRAFHENALFTQPLISVSNTEGDSFVPVPVSEAPAPRRRRRRRRRVKPASGAIFTALGVASKEVASDENTLSREGLKTYTLQDIGRVSAASPPKKKIEINSKVKAAIEISKSAPIFDIEPNGGILDETKEIENLLISQGGVTLDSLISESLSDSGSEIDNKNKKESEFTTPALKSTIVESVVISDNSKEFEKNIESKYKGQYLKKEALGQMFDTIKSVSIANKMINSEVKKTSYKDKVKSKTTSMNTKIQKQNNSKKAVEDEILGNWKAYTFNSKAEKVPATDDGDFGIVVYEKTETVKQEIVVANTMKISGDKIKTQPTVKPKRTRSRTTRVASVGAKQTSSKVSNNIVTSTFTSGGGY